MDGTVESQKEPVTKRYDVAIKADKDYAGKLVQNGTEKELIEGIKEIIHGTYFKERYGATVFIHEVIE